jgi:hypothetical protein
MLKKIVLKFNLSTAILSVFVVVLLGFSVTLFQYALKVSNSNKILTQKLNSTNTLNTELKLSVKEAKSSSLVQFTADDLRHDINKMYPALSSRVKTVIIDTILRESNKYNVNPLILYSLIHTESSMRPWIEHKRILITIKGKKKYIRAVGLGGVVWEWWGNALKKANIAEVRSDLFDPEVNIKAVAYIYNAFYKMEKHKKASTQDESAMIRYFGGGYKSYFVKIDTKVAQLIRQKLYRPCKKEKKENNGE